ncbi:MAG: YfiR family protein [Desulfamplus sp.]|nr:YfiR family protein [Desulfamplus sp.]
MMILLRKFKNKSKFLNKNITVILFIVLNAFLYTMFLPFYITLAKAQEPSKQEIQAAMIIKFTDFIEWSSDSFDKTSNNFTIAILGKNEYQGLFEPFIDRLFYGKQLKIIHYPAIENIYTDIYTIGKIQILIVSSSEKKEIKPLLDKLKGKPILTIGDFQGFAQNGGIINFFKKANNKIGFEINMESKELSGIKISSHLLKLAKIINSSEVKFQKDGNPEKTEKSENSYKPQSNDNGITNIGKGIKKIGEGIKSIGKEVKQIGQELNKKGGKL